MENKMKVAIHMLTPYPPSNPNRDELGMPKTATVGGALRQRISSQALKRSWRTSDIFEQLDAKMSTRTRELGVKVKDRVMEKGGDETLAVKVGRAIAEKFGKVDKKELSTSEVVILGHEEWQAAMDIADACAEGKREPLDAELELVQRQTTSIDVAMFGRMRAAMPSLNVDAAVSVAHALTTDKTIIESDFWTAVDDLNEMQGDAGAGGMGEREFGSGVYYSFAIVDSDKLIQNLGGNEVAATNAINALIEAMATTSPGGHRSSFAHHTYASYLAIEHADRVAGNMMLPAFEKPVSGTLEAIQSLRSAMKAISEAYDITPIVSEMSLPEGAGSLKDCLVK